MSTTTHPEAVGTPAHDDGINTASTEGATMTSTTTSATNVPLPAGTIRSNEWDAEGLRDCYGRVRTVEASGRLRDDVTGYTHTIQESTDEIRERVIVPPDLHPDHLGAGPPDRRGADFRGRRVRRTERGGGEMSTTPSDFKLLVDQATKNAQITIEDLEDALSVPPDGPLLGGVDIHAAIAHIRAAAALLASPSVAELSANEAAAK